MTSRRINRVWRISLVVMTNADNGEPAKKLAEREATMTTFERSAAFFVGENW